MLGGKSTYKTFLDNRIYKYKRINAAAIPMLKFSSTKSKSKQTLESNIFLVLFPIRPTNIAIYLCRLMHYLDCFSISSFFLPSIQCTFKFKQGVYNSLAKRQAPAAKKSAMKSPGVQFSSRYEMLGKHIPSNKKQAIHFDCTSISSSFFAMKEKVLSKGR